MKSARKVRMTFALMTLCCAMMAYCSAVASAADADFAGAEQTDSGQAQLLESVNDEHRQIAVANDRVTSRARLMAFLRRNLVAYYEDLPNAIRLCTKTIIAAQEAGDESIVAVARMQRSAASLRSVGFDECRSDFELAMRFSVRSADPELVLLFQTARTAVEQTLYSQSDCMNRLRHAVKSATGFAHSDVLFASEFELATRSFPEVPRTVPIHIVELRKKPVFESSSESFLPRDQLLKLLQQPLAVQEFSNSKDFISEDLNRVESLRSEFFRLPDLLTSVGAARRFQFEALCLSSMLLDHSGQSDAALENLATARKSMLKSGDITAVALTDIRIGEIHFRCGRQDSAKDALVAATDQIQLITAPSTLAQLSKIGLQLPDFSAEFNDRRASFSRIVQMRLVELQQQARWIKTVVKETELAQLQLLLADTSIRGDLLETERDSALDAKGVYLRLTAIGLVACCCLLLFLLRDRRKLRKVNSLLHAEMIARTKAADERNQLELHLAQSVRLESLGDLAGGIAHDFNNLLVGVLGNAELMRYTEKVSDRGVEYLDGITKAAETAADLSRKMLTYAGKQPMQKTSVELNQLVTRMLPLLRSGSGIRHSVEFTPSAHPVFTEADEGQLEQVLMNLVTNASHAMTNGRCCISIRVGVEILDQVVGDPSLFGNRQECGNFAWFEIKDTGRGIPSENISRVFEPFFTTKNSIRSHGFGLAVVFGHVNRHNGLIRLTSTESVGTTFRILLPRLSDFHADTVPPKQVNLQTEKPQSLTALVVDDQLQVRQVVESLFQANSWTVHSFGSACEALEFLSEETDVDCLLIDLMMPGVDGTTMLEELEHRGISIPVVVMSGYSTTDMNEVLRFRSVVSHIEKPFRPADLVNAMSAAVNAARGEISKSVTPDR